MHSLFTNSVSKKLSINQSIWLTSLLAILSGFCFGTIYSSLALFFNHVLAQSIQFSVSVYAVFATWIYSFAIIGGWMGGYISHRSCTVFGGLFIIAGLLVMSITHQPYWALALFVAGTGFYVPNFIVMLGQVFERKDSRRSYAYLWLYLGMNLGVFAGSLCSGPLIHAVGFYWMYSFGAISLTFALLLYLYIYHQMPFIEDSSCRQQLGKPFSSVKLLGIIVVLVIAVFALKWLLHNHAISDVIVTVLFVVTLLTLIVISFKPDQRFSEQDCARLKFFILLTVASYVFYALYNMESSVIMVYMDHAVDRTVFGYLIPTESLNAINPVWNVICGLIMYFIFRHFPWRLGTANKIYLGVAFAGVGFAVFAWASANHVSATGLVPLSWVIFGFFFLCLAEMMVAPLAYAMVGEYGTPAMQGVLVGAVQLAAGSSAALTDYLSHSAHFIRTESAFTFNHLFANAATRYAELGISAGVILLFVSLLVRGRFSH